MRDCKRGKDRLRVLLGVVLPVLDAHLRSLRRLHEREVGRSPGRVYPPFALARKYARARKAGVRSVWLDKRAACHTPRPGFAIHLPEAGRDIRTTQQLLWHKDLNTTMIYTQVSPQRASRAGARAGPPCTNFERNPKCGDGA